MSDRFGHKYSHALLHLALVACANTTPPTNDGKTCENATIVDKEDLLEAQTCDEITGDLILRSPTIESVELPRLSRIGRLLLSLGSWPLRELSLPALTQVGSAPEHLLEIGFGLPNLERISLPALQTVNGSMGIAAMAELRELDITALEQVTSHFGLVNLPKLTTLHQSAHIKVEGRMALEVLCHLSEDTLPDTSKHAPEQLTRRDLSCCVDPASCTATLCRCD